MAQETHVEVMADGRLDVALSEAAGETRSRVERLIRDGMAAVDGKIETKPGYKLHVGQCATLTWPAPVALDLVPENIPLEVLFEDDDLAVVVKPYGMVVHPAAGNETGTLVHALLYQLRGLSGIGGALRPGIVHRLDKDTSGLLMVAKNDRTHLLLSEMIQQHRMEKIYQAVAMGTFSQCEGVVDAPIARHPTDRKRMAVVENGRSSRTEYCVMQPLRGATLLRVHLITGRTHQIRVHMTHIGHPLLGDPMYGGKQNAQRAPRLMLHAWQLTFAHPITGELLHLEAPPPADFLETVRKLHL
ncbi:MAG: RluA family pseudouridine synthase [Clostridia bacterium]